MSANAAYSNYDAGPCLKPHGAACVRRELVPLALDAYPEAYEEFKRCMLVFVFGPESAGSTVGELWADSTRGAVAAQLARTLRQAAGVLLGTLLVAMISRRSRHGRAVMRPTARAQIHGLACKLACAAVKNFRCAEALPN